MTNKTKALEFYPVLKVTVNGGLSWQSNSYESIEAFQIDVWSMKNAFKEISFDCGITFHDIEKVKSLIQEEGVKADKSKIRYYKDFNFSMGECPSCTHIECDTRYSYCEKCGQKIIWPEDEKGKGEA